MQISTSPMPNISQAPLTAPAQGPPTPPQAGRPRLDPNAIEFKIQMETKQLNAPAMNRELAPLQFTCEACPSDCSHGVDGTNAAFQRIGSAVMTVANGGMQRIAEMHDRIRKGNAIPGNTGALRIYVRDSILDDRATTNLVNMHLANENILYRLGQAGGPGRSVQDKQRWSPPLSHGSASYTGASQHDISPVQPAAHWRSTFSNYHWGMNAGTQGWWEFRYFDSTMNTEALQANVRLLLGMVSAAVEGRGQWAQRKDLASTYHQPVSRKQWNDFMNAVVGPADKRLLEANFKASGGQIEPEKLSAEARTALSRLISGNYRFVDDTQPDRLLDCESMPDHLGNNKPVLVQTPGGGSCVLQTGQVEPYLLAETGANDFLDPHVVADVQAAAAIKQSGTRLVDTVSGGEVSPALAAVLGAVPGRVAARHGDASLTVGAPLTLARMAAIEKGDAAQIPAAAKPILARLDFFHSEGYILHASDDARPITWPAELASQFMAGKMVATRGGQSTPIATEKDIDALAYATRLARLNAADASLVGDLEQLMDRGFSFKQNDVALTKSSFALLDAVTKGAGELQVEVPKGERPTQLGSRETAEKFANIELGRDDRLSAEERETLATVENLRKRGYAFFNKSTENEINSRSGPLLTLQTPQHKLTMRAPGGKRRTRVSLSAMRNLVHLEEGARDKMDAPLRMALERAETLRAMGYSFLMQDLKANDGKGWVEANVAELLATLDGKRPLNMMLPRGGQVELKGGPHPFLVDTDSHLDVLRNLTPAQRQDLDRFHAMLGAQQVVGCSVSAPVTHTAQIPWMLAHNESIHVTTPAEQAVNANAAQQWGVTIGGWENLHRFVTIEAKATEGLDAGLVTTLAQVDGLRSAGIVFHHVAANKQEVPIGFNSEVVHHLGTNGVSARLPRWTIWKGWPRKRVAIKGTADLARLAAKYVRSA